MMKLSEKTIKTLTDFSRINPSIQFTEGNVLRTVSRSKTILARAELEHDIEGNFAIYDLPRFLGVLTLFDNPTIEEEGGVLTITDGERVVRYVCADPSTIIVPPKKDIELANADITFDVTSTQIDRIMKALSVMNLPELLIVGENGKIKLRAADTKNPTSDKYDLDVGDTDKTFSVVFRTENLKIVSGDYTITVSSAGISHFESSNGVQYWIAVESNSKFD
jgi:hypothetical protein